METFGYALALALSAEGLYMDGEEYGAGTVFVALCIPGAASRGALIRAFKFVRLLVGSDVCTDAEADIVADGFASIFRSGNMAVCGIAVWVVGSSTSSESESE